MLSTPNICMNMMQFACLGLLLVEFKLHSEQKRLCRQDLNTCIVTRLGNKIIQGNSITLEFNDHCNVTFNFYIRILKEAKFIDKIYKDTFKLCLKQTLINGYMMGD